MAFVCRDGGSFVAAALKAHGVEFIFTLSGGHICPILVSCKREGIRVIDVRHEVNAVFAADAVSRLTGIPGVAVVTAGPGVTNTITAMENARLAQSPLILIGGATATVLRGRGALQDIDQMALIKPHVKWRKSVKRVRDIVPAIETAFQKAQEGVPGPVFVEIPIDLLFPMNLVQEMYGAKGRERAAKSFQGKAIHAYLGFHTRRLFSGIDAVPPPEERLHRIPKAEESAIASVADYLKASSQPVMLIGSQSMLAARESADLVQAIEKIGIPVYLSGMTRGLLGKNHRLQLRHQRRLALKGADLVILAGVPCDFRLDYGSHINSRATLITVNRKTGDLRKNRRPTLPVHADPAIFLRDLASQVNHSAEKFADWHDKLKQQDENREKQIDLQAQDSTELINPLKLCQLIEKSLDQNSIVVADGGDFVATASYVLQPRNPLSWLDPGVFGTLGVGGGFALGAALCRPDSEIWLIYGDGSCAFSLAEFDTFVRHGLGVIAVVGNDAGWTQIAREQVRLFNDDVGTVLRHTDYHVAAQGFGGVGFRLDTIDEFEPTVAKAKAIARNRRPVLINALISNIDFRKGSISL